MQHWFLLFMNFTALALGMSDNGWIPLTHEEALSKLGGVTRRSAIEANPYLQRAPYQHKHTPDYNIINDEAVKLVNPQNIFQLSEENVLDLKTNKSSHKITSEEFRNQDNSNYHNGIHQVSKAPVNWRGDRNSLDRSIQILNTRQPKTIMSNNHSRTGLPHNIAKRISKENQDVLEVDVSKKEEENNDLQQNRKNYEVTEDVADTWNGDESINESFGYFYKPRTQNPNNTKKYNITDTFFDILSKYNIQRDDDLPNYTLSRGNKVQSYRMLHPIPLRIHPQLNNLNHLSVDPLLAVFLSNYVYYLPGLFGIHSQYRNLYGYLASNNIHNNKPFGSYKIFSDTDSSN